MTSPLSPLSPSSPSSPSSLPWRFARLASLLLAAAALPALPSAAHTAPVLDVEIVSPQDGATVSGFVLITGTSTDVGGGVVSVSIDDGPFLPASGTDVWTFLWNAGAAAPGPHTIRARAKATPFSLGVFDAVQVVVSGGTGIAVAIESPPDGSLVTDTLHVEGTSAGADLVVLRVDDGPALTVNGLEQWSAILEPSTLGPGPHTLRAEATAGTSIALDSVSIDVGAGAPGVQSFVYSSSVDGEPLTGKLYLPAGFDPSGPPVPLVVHLHGAGGSGSISAAMGAELEARGWIGVAPDGRAWELFDLGCEWPFSSAYVDNPDPAVGPGEQDIFDAIDWASSAFPIEPDRVYLTGFSYGGRGTYAIGLKSPDRFAAIAPMGAVSDVIEVFARRPEPCLCKEALEGGQFGDSPFVDTMYKITSGRFLLENAVNVPVYHAHGTQDSAASNNVAFAPFLHGWHMVNDTGWSEPHTTPSTLAEWANSCYDGDGSALPLAFAFGHTPTLSEMAALLPGEVDWAYMMTPVGHVTDPRWLSGTAPGLGIFGVPDPSDPASLLGIYDFFAARTREASPDAILYKTYEDQHRGAFWVELLSETPWLDRPAAVRAVRDGDANAVQLALVRARSATLDVEAAGLVLAPDAPLTIHLSELDPTGLDPALAAPGETLVPSLILTGDFADGLAGTGCAVVTRDGAPLDSALVASSPSAIEIGPLLVTGPTELVVRTAGAYGAGCPGSGGFSPALAMPGCVEPGRSFSLELSEGLGGAPALLVVGTETGALPLGNGCHLLLDDLIGAPIALTLSGAGPGAGALDVPVTIAPGVPAGTVLTAQVFAIDAGAPGLFCASNGALLAVR